MQSNPDNPIQCTASACQFKEGSSKIQCKKAVCACPQGSCPGGQLCYVLFVCFLRRASIDESHSVLIM